MVQSYIFIPYIMTYITSCNNNVYINRQIHQYIYLRISKYYFTVPGIKMTYPELCPEQEMNVRGNREFVAGMFIL